MPSRLGFEDKQAVSVCVERPYELNKRKAAVDSNTRLAEQSDGLLARKGS